MSSREVSRDELTRMMDMRMQEKDEVYERYRRESQVQIQELTTRLDAMEIQRREEKARFDEEREQLKSRLMQVMDDHRKEIKALTERYKRDRTAILRDLDNLRQENDQLKGEKRDDQRLIADLQNQLIRQNNPVMVPVPCTPATGHDRDRDLSTIEKFIEFLKANGNDLYWQKFFAGAEFTTGIGLAVGAYFAAPNMIVILFAMLAAGVTIDALRRAYIAFTAPHDHYE